MRNEMTDTQKPPRIKKENLPGVKTHKSIPDALKEISKELERQHIKVVKEKGR